MSSNLGTTGAPARRRNPATPKPARHPAEAVRAELAACEAKLLSLLDSREALIAEVCHYLIDGAGKRLRPLFVLLVYRACGGTDRTLEDAIDTAVAIELIHSATLLHDDIIDGGTLRRGRPSALCRYGASLTLIAGDYLFCRAFELCGRFEESLVRTAAQACIQLTEGEVMEGRLRHNSAATVSEYLAIIRRKTASLFAAGARVAAHLAGADQRAIAAAEKLGDTVGIAFQMIDDLLDILGPEEKIGKPVGSDIRLGIPSLPVVLAAEKDAHFRHLFTNGGNPGEADLEKLLAAVRQPDLIAQVRAMAEREATRARQVTAGLAPSVYRDGLARLIDIQTNRKA